MIKFVSNRNEDRDLIHQLNECWQKVLGRAEIGFPHLTENETEWQAIVQRVKQARPVERILVIGIGGSSLGVQVIAQSLEAHNKSKFYFLESPDPLAFKKLGDLNGAEWRERHIIVVSKSGNTLETLAWVERLNALEANWLKNSELTVIASPGEGPLQTWAKARGAECLWIPTNVGGRFSVLTAVGMLPAALMGRSPEKFREGAAWALKNSELASRISAEVLQSWERQEWITQMWSYSEGLRFFGEWWQQLWGESLGKKLTREGKPAPRASTPMACAGPRDQHSLVQQLMEGARDKYVLVTRVKAEENSTDSFTPELFPTMPFAGHPVTFGRIVSAEAQAFEKSLSESKISYAVVQLENLSEQTIGAYFMLWQMCIAQLGEYMQIDAFNQPGVESGKKHAHRILAEIRA